MFREEGGEIIMLYMLDVECRRTPKDEGVPKVKESPIVQRQGLALADVGSKDIIPCNNLAESCATCNIIVHNVLFPNTKRFMSAHLLPQIGAVILCTTHALTPVA
jgi:hypothetical protein